MTDIDDLQELAAGVWWIAGQKIQRRIKKMRIIKIYDRATKSYIGEIKANKEQIRTIEHDFIVKEV